MGLLLKSWSPEVVGARTGPEEKNDAEEENWR